MPCWEAFRSLPKAERDAILPPTVRARVSVEAGVTMGWAEWIGDAGASVGLDRFGASAPANRLFDEFGITVEQVVAAVRRVLGR